MPYKKITMDMSVTVNLGNYQNARLGLEVEYVLEEGETLDTAQEKVSRDLRAGLLDEMQPALRVVGAYERDRWVQVVDAPLYTDVDTLRNEDDEDGLDLTDPDEQDGEGIGEPYMTDDAPERLVHPDNSELPF